MCIEGKVLYMSTMCWLRALSFIHDLRLMSGVNVQGLHVEEGVGGFGGFQLVVYVPLEALFQVFIIKYAISYIHVPIAYDNTILFLCHMTMKLQTNTKQVVNYW